jgi:hypothetical protein
MKYNLSLNIHCAKLTYKFTFCKFLEVFFKDGMFSTLTANGSGYVQWRIRGRFSVGTTKKIERESDLHPPPKPPWHIAVVKHWRFS